MDKILKLILVHASVIFRFPEFAEFTEFPLFHFSKAPLLFLPLIAFLYTVMNK